MNEHPYCKYRYLPTITGLFVATLLVSNVLNSKVIRVGALRMAGGLLLFPLAYLFSDLLTEVYGYAESRKVIWTGFASLLLLVIIEICGALPGRWSPLYRIVFLDCTKGGHADFAPTNERQLEQLKNLDHVSSSMCVRVLVYRIFMPTFEISNQ